MRWDNANHLYAYVEGFTDAPDYVDGYLYVRTLTVAGATRAPESPHEFYGPISTAVQGPGLAVQALTT